MTFTLQISTSSLQGTSRQRNEDAVCVDGTFLDPLQPSQKDFSAINPTEGTLMIIADGMGGHPRGDWASKSAIEAILSGWQTTSPLIDACQAVNAAHRALISDARGMPSPGSTVAAAVIYKECCSFFNVGDSPILYWRDGNLEELSTKDRASEEDKNILSQCIGGWADDAPRPHFGEKKLNAGDKIILMTDGVADHISDHELRRLLDGSRVNLASNVCGQARKNGSDDDTSVIIAHVD